MSKSLADNKALLAHILDGAALPEHLAKNRGAGLDRKAVAREIDEKLERAPLIAVCFKHSCRCGHEWQDFGFYARRTAVDVPGQARAYPTRRLDYFPHNERVSETIWQSVEEPACLNCYGGVSLLIAAGGAK